MRAGRIAAIPADCKSAAHWASLVRVQPGAQASETSAVRREEMRGILHGR